MSDRVLYVTYDGIADPLGKSQVLPYVRGLADRGYPMDLLSFEKPGKPLSFGDRLESDVRWFALRYHQRPSVPATTFDVAQGLGATAALDMLAGARCVHVRSYVSAMMSLPWTRLRGIPLIFDTRALYVDERIEAGAWRAEDRFYRFAKGVERQLMRHSTVITVLTHAMQRFLREEYEHRDEIKAPIRVIPTCTDLELFRPDGPAHAATAAALGGARTLLYQGSLSGRYRPDLMARFYLHWRRAKPGPSRLLVVSRQEPTAIAKTLREAGDGAEAELVHRSADRDDIASLIRCATAGIFFYQPALSTYGTAPTKLGEMLACGLPVAGNAVGDVARVLAEGAGVLVADESDEAFAAAARALAAMEVDGIAEKARAVAKKWFSLEEGIAAYAKIYDAVLSGRVRDLTDSSWPEPLTSSL